MKNPKDNCIIYSYRGSIAHNMYVPPEEEASTDDVDLIGVAVPPIEYYLGLKHWEQAEYKSGNEDIVIYDFKKFMRLLIKANPNVLSVLWNNPEMYLKTTFEGDQLLSHRRQFSTKQAYYTYGGYAKSQLKKMFSGACQGYMGAKRKELMKKFGYDCKNAAHLIRLLYQGINFLNTGELIVYEEGENRQHLLDIKQGKWSANLVEELAKELFRYLDQAYDTSPLPEKADMDWVNTFMVKTLNSYYGKTV